VRLCGSLLALCAPARRGKSPSPRPSSRLSRRRRPRSVCSTPFSRASERLCTPPLVPAHRIAGSVQSAFAHLISPTLRRLRLSFARASLCSLKHSLVPLPNTHQHHSDPTATLHPSPSAKQPPPPSHQLASPTHPHNSQWSSSYSSSVPASSAVASSPLFSRRRTSTRSLRSTGTTRRLPSWRNWV
jgi:hypothetical protein